MGMLTFALLFNIVLEVLARIIEQENEIKWATGMD